MCSIAQDESPVLGLPASDSPPDTTQLSLGVAPNQGMCILEIGVEDEMNPEKVLFKA